VSPERWRRVLKPALRGEITLSQFEMRFMRLWHETRQRGERNPKVVEDLFHYVKNYVADSSRITPGAVAFDDKQVHAALRRTHSELAPKGALGFMQSWFAVIPLYVAMIAVAGAQEIPMPPAETPAPAVAPAPNPILVLEGCVRTRAQQLEISREAADLVAVAAIQKCSRELTAATNAGGQRSLAEARQQLKDAMREIAVTEIVDIRAARYQPPPVKEAEPKPAPKKVVRRKAKPAAPKPAAPAATPPQ
jgi:hypothetical protein